MRWILPALAFTATLMSLLTFLRAPDYVWAWKLAIIAGEYGHWLVLLPLGLAALAGIGTAGVWRIAALLLCLVAIAGFLRPMFSAWRIAARLSGEMTAAFGGEAGPAGFSLRRLYLGSDVPPAARRTEIFARPDGQELKLDF